MLFFDYFLLVSILLHFLYCWFLQHVSLNQSTHFLVFPVWSVLLSYRVFQYLSKHLSSFLFLPSCFNFLFSEYSPASLLFLSHGCNVFPLKVSVTFLILTVVSSGSLFYLHFSDFLSLFILTSVFRVGCLRQPPTRRPPVLRSGEALKRWLGAGVHGPSLSFGLTTRHGFSISALGVFGARKFLVAGVSACHGMFRPVPWPPPTSFQPHHPFLSHWKKKKISPHCWMPPGNRGALPPQRSSAGGCGRPSGAGPLRGGFTVLLLEPASWAAGCPGAPPSTGREVAAPGWCQRGPASLLLCIACWPVPSLPLPSVQRINRRRYREREWPLSGCFFQRLPTCTPVLSPGYLPFRVCVVCGEARAGCHWVPVCRHLDLTSFHLLSRF